MSELPCTGGFHSAERAVPTPRGGEFHTFVVDGPGFATPVDVAVDRVERRDRSAAARLR